MITLRSCLKREQSKRGSGRAGVNVEKDLGETSLYLTVDDIRANADEVQRSASAIVSLVARIFAEVALAPIEVAERVDLLPKRTSI
jgi:hypothetical protein